MTTNASAIAPNHAFWILHTGRVLRVSEEGWNDEETAFSHGIFVKQWVKFRTCGFFPEAAEVELARTIERRAKQLLAEHPELTTDDGESEEDAGDPNPFAGDLAYVHAAEEQGWIRVKPLPHPVHDNRVFFETVDAELLPPVAVVVDLVKARGLEVVLLTGGAFENRGFWVNAAAGGRTLPTAEAAG